MTKIAFCPWCVRPLSVRCEDRYCPDCKEVPPEQLVPDERSGVPGWALVEEERLRKKREGG
jgi:hypothetical protein